MSWGLGLIVVGVICLAGMIFLSGIEDVENDYS